MENSLLKKQRVGITGGTIKIIAVIVMTLDHFGWMVIDRQLWMRGMVSYPDIATPYYLSAYETLYGLSYSFHIIGRLAFPLFVFLVVEGVHHTRSFKKYFLTMLGFAVLAEVPYNLMYGGKIFAPGGQNTLFTLLICMTAVYAIRRFGNKWYFALPAAAACAMAAHLLNVDYGFKAVIMACIMEVLFEKKVLGFSLGCAFMGLFNPWEFCCLAAAPLIKLYNGERGLKLKYVFYIYYPLHLVIIYIISRLIL